MTSKQLSIISIAAIALALSAPSFCYAEIINNAQWMVRSGDSVYSIARKIFPGDAKKQARLRRELVNANPEIFRGNANLMSVGSTLKLPEFAISNTQPKKTITPQKARIAPAEPKKQPLPNPPAVVQKVAMDNQEAVGRVLINIGEIEASNRGGLRKLTRNSSIYKGDTISTSAQTHTQLRMKDGALISLRPNTEIVISQYEYNGLEDGSERSILELIRGGFRTITGAIGHKNKQNYQVKTSVATIGIRGTHYGLMLCNAGSCQNDSDQGNLQDGLYGGVVDGSIIAQNEAGVFSFGNDQFFHIHTAQTPAVETLLPLMIFNDTRLPSRPPEKRNNDSTPERPPGEFKSDQMMALLLNNGEFKPPQIRLELPDQNITTYEQPLPPKAPDGSGMALAFTYRDPAGRNGVGAPIYITPVNGNNIFLENITLPNGNVVANLPFAIFEQSLDPNGVFQQHEGARLRPDGSGASYLNLGGNANLGVNWGRWSGNFVILENGALLNHDLNMHFIYSPNLTPLTTLANLGGLRSRIQVYRFAGGTLPTNHLGQVAASNPNIFADVDFINHQLLNYSVDANVAGINWYGNLANPVNFTELNRSFQISGPCHNTVCDGEASLLFVGSSAGGAMTSYSLVDSNGGGISGSALLTPLTLATSPDNYAALFATNIGVAEVSFPVLTNSSSVDNVYLSGGNPVIANDRFTDLTGDHYVNLMVNPSQATLSGTGLDNISIPNTTVSWGRWSAAGNDISITKDGNTQNLADVLFIQSNNITTPTQLAGLTGKGTAVGYGGTPNVYMSGTQVAGSVTMVADFTLGRITSYSADAGISAPTLAGTASNIPFTRLSNGFALSGGGVCPGCTGTASVQFVGSQASGAITSFSLTDGASTASGTALLIEGF